MDQQETVAAILAAALIRNNQVISANTAVELYEKCLADLREKYTDEPAKGVVRQVA